VRSNEAMDCKTDWTPLDDSIIDLFHLLQLTVPSESAAMISVYTTSSSSSSLSDRSFQLRQIANRISNSVINDLQDHDTKMKILTSSSLWSDIARDLRQAIDSSSRALRDRVASDIGNIQRNSRSPLLLWNVDRVAFSGRLEEYMTTECPLVLQELLSSDLSAAEGRVLERLQSFFPQALVESKQEGNNEEEEEKKVLSGNENELELTKMSQEDNDYVLVTGNEKDDDKEEESDDEESLKKKKKKKNLSFAELSGTLLVFW